MRTKDFDFFIPTELIAQAPEPERDRARLLTLERTTKQIHHRRFADVPSYLRPGDLLILNDSRVIPARLHGIKAPSGGRIEALLLEQNNVNDWWAMLRPGKRAPVGTTISFRDRFGQMSPIEAIVVEKNSEGHGRLKFLGAANLLQELDLLGSVPLPPYITRTPLSGGIDDLSRYQTVFARTAGSVAAPTAGLHFTPKLLAEIQNGGVAIRYITLHVGLGTFAPVKSETVQEHLMHEERFSLNGDTAKAINETKAAGGRIIAVGTTSVRVLESVAAANQGELTATEGRTRIFIYPPHQFRVVDALITNFHLPRSTLLMLVSAFASPNATDGREIILSAYEAAVRERYRFFSYGDAMMIL